MLKGALFHAFMPSLMNVCFDKSEKLNTLITSFEIDLIALDSWSGTLFEILNEWSSSFVAFHISDNFICAFIWLTDNMLNLVRREAVLIWSLILVPFSSLSILFWESWRSFSSLGVGSDSFHLILLHSWRPYLILELNTTNKANILRVWWIYQRFGFWGFGFWGFGFSDLRHPQTTS